MLRCAGHLGRFRRDSWGLASALSGLLSGYKWVTSGLQVGCKRHSEDTSDIADLQDLSHLAKGGTPP